MGLFSSLFGSKNSDISQQEKQDKKNFEILKYDGIRARNMHQYAYAIKCLKEATAIKEDVETMEYLANAYVTTGEIEEGRKLYTRLSEIEPENCKNLLALANVCFLQEDYTCMDQTCKKIITLDDKNQAGYYLAAKAAKGLKDFLQTIVMLTKAISCNEDFIEAYLLRAETLMEMGQAKEALKDIDVILSKDESNEDALVVKGEIEAQFDHIEKGLACLEQVISLNPFNVKAYLLKGNILLKQKKAEEAINSFDEAIELIPNNAELYKERGRAKLLKGDEKGSC